VVIKRVNPISCQLPIKIIQPHPPEATEATQALAGGDLHSFLDKLHSSVLPARLRRSSLHLRRGTLLLTLHVVRSLQHYQELTRPLFFALGELTRRRKVASQPYKKPPPCASPTSQNSSFLQLSDPFIPDRRYCPRLEDTEAYFWLVRIPSFR
jgi:hypothetical protein